MMNIVNDEKLNIDKTILHKFVFSHQKVCIQNRVVIAWRGAASAGLVSSADRADMKAPVPRFSRFSCN